MNLSESGCRERQERLFARSKSDFLVISDPHNLLYLTGFHVPAVTLASWGPNFLLLERASGRSTLLVHDSLGEAAEQAYADRVSVWTWYDGASRPGKLMFSEALWQLEALLRRAAGSSCGVEMGVFPAGTGCDPGEDLTRALSEMRRSKDPDEVTLIRDAIRVGAAGHRAAREAVQPGVTELDVYNEVFAAMVREAGHPILPMGDLVSGERAAGMAGQATSRVIEEGDLMILDLFPVVNGYRSDNASTVCAARSLTDEQARLEEAVHAAMRSGEATLRPGTVAKEVYHAMRGAFADAGFPDALPHHGGHGLGLGHPEAPFFVPESEEVIQEGDVVTLEPGAYSNTASARIEHNFLVHGDRPERLTSHVTTFLQA